MENIEFKINTEFIKLQQILKAANIALRGSDAKLLILKGNVKVNGKIVYERGKKIHSGDEIYINGFGYIKVLGAD